MAVVCPACGTENRDGARFCKGCGGKLAPESKVRTEAAHASEWPATEPAPLQTSRSPVGLFEPGVSAPARSSTAATPFEDERTVIVSPASRAQRVTAESTLLAPSMAESALFPPSSPPSSSYFLQRGPPSSTFVAADDVAPRRHPEAPLALPAPKASGGFGIGVILLLVAILAGAGWYWFSGSGAAPEAPVAVVPPAAAPAATGSVEPAPAAASNAAPATLAPEAAPAAAAAA
ncbi:MAG: hypothetical protein JWQ73_1505, partial [Variovorax sp.]|nr:hypothetical protein [Variovorax sp.]